jgi:hypothetical protein
VAYTDINIIKKLRFVIKNSYPPKGTHLISNGQEGNLPVLKVTKCCKFLQVFTELCKRKFESKIKELQRVWMWWWWWWWRWWWWWWWVILYALQS